MLRFFLKQETDSAPVSVPEPESQPQVNNNAEEEESRRREEEEEAERQRQAAEETRRRQQEEEDRRRREDEERRQREEEEQRKRVCKRVGERNKDKLPGLIYKVNPVMKTMMVQDDNSIILRQGR